MLQFCWIINKKNTRAYVQLMFSSEEKSVYYSFKVYIKLDSARQSL